MNYWLLLTLSILFFSGCASSHPYCREVCYYNKDADRFQDCHDRCMERMGDYEHRKEKRR